MLPSGSDEEEPSSVIVVPSVGFEGATIRAVGGSLTGTIPVTLTVPSARPHRLFWSHTLTRTS